jgi:hypothetical protein
MKMNVDAALFTKSQRMEIDLVIRDHDAIGPLIVGEWPHPSPR